MSEVDVLFAALRQAADPQAVECIENLVMRGSDRYLNRINALAFADAHGLDHLQMDAFKPRFEIVRQVDPGAE
ncbi:DUF5939 domain-containing protein, partial [Rhizobium ruizarguesonis]